MKLVSTLAIVLLMTGCHKKATLVPSKALLNPYSIPQCIEGLEHYEFDKTSPTNLKCAPNWNNDSITHHPACLWVQGSDEICNSQT